MREKERERERETDRESSIDMKTDRWTERKIDGQKGRFMHSFVHQSYFSVRLRDGQEDRQTERQIYKKTIIWRRRTEKQKSRIDEQTDIQTERQIDRKTDRRRREQIDRKVGLMDKQKDK